MKTAQKKKLAEMIWARVAARKKRFRRPPVHLQALDVIYTMGLKEFWGSREPRIRPRDTKDKVYIKIMHLGSWRPASGCSGPELFAIMPREVAMKALILGFLPKKI